MADRRDAVAEVSEVARDVGLADDVVAHPEEGARRVEAVARDELAERVVQRLERRAEMPRDEDGRLADVRRARRPQPRHRIESPAPVPIDCSGVSRVGLFHSVRLEAWDACEGRHERCEVILTILYVPTGETYLP